MIEPAELLEQLSRIVTATPTEDGVRVSTHVLYPSNGAVSVVVRGGAEHFQISDEGAGVAEFASAGISTIASDRMLAHQVKRLGLLVYGGAIMSPMVPADAVPAAILLVANASRSIAEWGLSNLHFRVHRNFRRDLAELLGRYFHDNLKNDAPIIGKSNKPHKFGHVIYLDGDRKLLVDPVVNEASSINARLVANLDVRLAENPDIKQLIVYDDSLNWKSSDLRLLEMGARTVAFSRAEAEIQKLAA